MFLSFSNVISCKTLFIQELITRTAFNVNISSENRGWGLPENFFFFFFGGGGVLPGSLSPDPISDQKNVIFHTSCQYIPYDNTLNFITLCRTKIHGVLF